MWNTNCHIIKKLSLLIKQYDKSIYIVCGGAYIAENYNTEFELKKILALNSINCLIMGEGERTLLEIIDCIEENKYPINILGTKSIDLSSKVKINPLREEEKNIDVFPFPDYSCYNIEDYSSHKIPLTFSRGCQWRCKFCTVFVHWKRFRTRSALNIFDEILFRIKEYDMKKYEFELHDCACNQNLEVLEQLCNIIINDVRTYKKVFFSANAKIIKRMDCKLLNKMRLAGFKNLKFGLESFSNNVLKLMHKPYTAEEASEVIKKVYFANIEVALTMIIGFPGETEEDFDDTIKFVEENYKYITEINFNLCFINDVIKYNFCDVLDMNNKDIYKWNLKDMSNTYEIRRNRLKRIDEALMSKFKNIKKEGMCYINIDNKEV